MRNLVLLGVFIAVTAFLPAENTCSQGVPEPGLLGVSYRDLAEWNMMYGRGRVYGGYAPQFYGQPEMGYSCAPEEPSMYDTPRSQSRSGRK